MHSEVVEETLFYSATWRCRDTNTAFKVVVPNPIDDDAVDILAPIYEEVKVAITHLKNNKAAGSVALLAVLFKTGCNELIRCMHQFIHKV